MGQMGSEVPGGGFETRYKLYFCMAMWVEQKGSEATCCGFKPQYRKLFLHLMWGSQVNGQKVFEAQVAGSNPG